MNGMLMFWDLSVSRPIHEEPHLWDQLSASTLDSLAPAKFVWKWRNNGGYSI
uniref:Uncharacterized protein n=1 Tax=Aegilops tauschii subsp. strangulata TaxID=200361 RepID=A0A453ADC5_AEGTS